MSSSRQTLELHTSGVRGPAGIHRAGAKARSNRASRESEFDVTTSTVCGGYPVQTEGGEALPLPEEVISGAQSVEYADVIQDAVSDDPWYAVWTHSHCEHVVADQLTAKGFLSFLPQMQTWSKRAGSMHLIRTPMFPGYLFVRDSMEKKRYIDLLKVRGIVRVLEHGWERLTPIPGVEIDAIQRIVEADLPVLPHAHLQVGDRVRVREGALTGVEGIFVQGKHAKGRLVVSIAMLGRSVSVEVDCTAVEATSSRRAV